MEKKESGNNIIDNNHNPYPRRRKNNALNQLEKERI
jgi:hypothetical protein